MPKFRRRTFDYEAVQYTGANLPEIIRFVAGNEAAQVIVPGGNSVLIDCKNANLSVRPHDWVVREAGSSAYVLNDPMFREYFESEVGAEVDAAFRAGREREAMARRIERYANGPLPGEKL